MELAVFQSIVKRISSRPIGLTDIPQDSLFPKALAVFLTAPSATTFVVVSSSRKLRFPFRVLQLAPARYLSISSTFHGVLLPFATSTSGVHSREHPRLTLFRPQSFSLSRRVSPPPALQVCFTLQPRLGFSLQGFSLPLGRTTSSVAVALLPLGYDRYLRLAPKAPQPQPRLQGLAPSESPSLFTRD